jgi:hypothetical protein
LTTGTVPLSDARARPDSVPTPLEGDRPLSNASLVRRRATTTPLPPGRRRRLRDSRASARRANASLGGSSQAAPLGRGAGAQRRHGVGGISASARVGRAIGGAPRRRQPTPPSNGPRSSSRALSGGVRGGARRNQPTRTRFCIDVFV